MLVALWACWPHSAVLAMPYTEALFVALAAWSLVALLDGRWVAAGVLSLLAGATRPMGTALAVAVVVAAAVATVRTLRCAAGYSNSKARFLLGAFTLLVPLARLLARIPVPVLVVLLGGLAGLSAWYNAYVLVAWPYSP